MLKKQKLKILERRISKLVKTLEHEHLEKFESNFMSSHNSSDCLICKLVNETKTDFLETQAEENRRKGE